MTTTKIEAALAALKAALAKGVRVVQFNGRRTEYNSPADIEKAIAYFEGQLESAGGTTRIKNIRLYSESIYD